MSGWDGERYRMTFERFMRLRDEHGLSNTEAVVLWTLTDFDHRDPQTGLRKGVVWPTLAVLAQRSRGSVKQVRSARERLEAAGLVTVTPVPSEDNGSAHRGPTVTLHWDRIVGEAPVEVGAALAGRGAPEGRGTQDVTRAEIVPLPPRGGVPSRAGNPSPKRLARGNVEALEENSGSKQHAQARAASGGNPDHMDPAGGCPAPGVRPADPPNPPAPLPSTAASVPRTGARTGEEAAAPPAAVLAPASPPMRPVEPVRTDKQRPTPEVGHPSWQFLLPQRKTGLQVREVYDELCSELPTYAAVERWRELYRAELARANRDGRAPSWERRLDLAQIATYETTPHAAGAGPASPRSGQAVMAELRQRDEDQLQALLTRLAAENAAQAEPAEPAGSDPGPAARRTAQPPARPRPAAPGPELVSEPPSDHQRPVAAHRQAAALRSV